ncbi:MAG: VOC family protein [Pseudomonadota bacterium]
MLHCHLHHVHCFASDIDVSVDWWRRMLDASVAFDGELAGARNIFLRVGDGRLHLYDQAPRGVAPNAVHHIGIRTDDLDRLVAHMERKGQAFRGAIRNREMFRYIMVAAPDGVLLELFEFDRSGLPADLARYLSDATG